MDLISMEIQKTKHQIYLDRWRALVKSCRSSGETIKAWCKQEGINESTYYRWQKLVWESETEKSSVGPYRTTEVTFAEYKAQSSGREPTVLSNAPALTLQVGQIRIEIQNGAEQDLIENTLLAIRKLC